MGDQFLVKDCVVCTTHGNGVVISFTDEGGKVLPDAEGADTVHVALDSGGVKPYSLNDVKRV